MQMSLLKTGFSYLLFIPIHFQKSFSIYFDTVLKVIDLSLFVLVALKKAHWGAWKASFRKSILW